MNNELKIWLKESKQTYNIFRNMPLKRLQFLGRMAGLAMLFYTTKRSIALALTQQIGVTLPTNIKHWK